MFNLLKSVIGGNKKAGLPIELPEAFPLDGTEVETAPRAECPHKPDHIKADVNHTGHMRVFAASDEEASALEAEAMRHVRGKKTVFYGETAVSAYISGPPPLRLITITKNGDKLCTYPFFNLGKPLEARITGITECRNGYEGQLEIFTKGSTLSFFDVMYFKNKNLYYPGKEVKVALSGIAYVLARAGDASDNDLAIQYENGDVDDYVFRGMVKEVLEFDALGGKARAVEVPLRASADSAIEIHICVTQNVLNEKLRKGDYVSGIMWLHGLVL
ncbi:hypothetical protein [Methanocella conradii]|uniref:hypothetical protein n=1 Tax=Methanocella conradii TaxID=1175444 RepID=UPI00157C64A2|nr:hypothetical protein [Methanocella conradii]